MAKSSRKGPGCLVNIILIILIAVLAYLIYRGIAGLGSADIEITSLSVQERIDRDGEPVEGTVVIALEITNTGSREGNFTLDISKHNEARSQEGLNTDLSSKIWTFSSELYYPSIDKWIELENSKYWGGDKITPGALEITLKEHESLDLEFYMKSSRGWRIQPPEGLAISDSLAVAPQKLRISVISPDGEAAMQMALDL